jgi:hypothetical protein
VRAKSPGLGSLFVGSTLLLLALPLCGQEADGIDASWAVSSAGGEASSAGDFEASSAIGLFQVDPNTAQGDTFEAVGTFFVEAPPIAETRPEMVFTDEFEDLPSKLSGNRVADR